MVNVIKTIGPVGLLIIRYGLWSKWCNKSTCTLKTQNCAGGCYSFVLASFVAHICKGNVTVPNLQDEICMCVRLFKEQVRCWYSDTAQQQQQQQHLWVCGTNLRSLWTTSARRAWCQGLHCCRGAVSHAGGNRKNLGGSLEAKLFWSAPVWTESWRARMRMTDYLLQGPRP